MFIKDKHKSGINVNQCICVSTTNHIERKNDAFISKLALQWLFQKMK